MINLVFRWLIVGLVTWVTLPGAIAAEKIRWKFQPGDRYDVVLSQTSVLKTRVNRTDVRVDLELGSEMAWQVQSVKPNGNAVMKQVYTRMNVKVSKTAKPTIRYDTASDEEPADNARHFAAVYDQLVGIEFLVEMSDRGEIVDVTLDPEDLETIRQIPESMQARRLFEKRGLVELLNEGGFVLPENEIQVGDQWPVTKQQKLSFGTAGLESVFTFEGLDESTGIATFQMQATTQLEDQPENPLEKPLVLKSQKQTGTLKFNSREGFLDSVDSTRELVTEKPFREMTVNTESMVEQQIQITKRPAE